MPAVPNSVETHTWGPRPAILNDLSRDEETEEMGTDGEDWAGDGVGADLVDVGGERIKPKSGLAKCRCAR